MHWIALLSRGLFAASRILVVLSSSAVTACGSMNRAPYHSVSVVNELPEVISEVEVAYGDRVLQFGKMNPKVQRSEGRDMSIPDRVTVRWKSADGTTHAATAPIRLFGLFAPRAIEIQLTPGGIELYRSDRVDKYASTYSRIYP